MKRVCWLFLLLMAACANPHPGFDELSDGHYYRLVRFGDGQRTTAQGAYVELRSTLGFHRDTSPDYDIQFILQQPEPDAVAGAWIAPHFQTLKSGDSVQFILPYAALAESLLDEYSVDSLPVPDTTLMQLNLGILNVWTQEEFEAMQQAEVQEGRVEEDAFLREVLEKRGLLDSLIEKDGAYYRVLSRDPEGVALIEGTPIELDRIGTFLDGSVFEHSRLAGTTMVFKLGDHDQVVPGIERVLEALHYGDKAWCVMPSYLAFGREGSADGTVPGNTPVCFELDVRYPADLKPNTATPVSSVDPIP